MLQLPSKKRYNISKKKFESLSSKCNKITYYYSRRSNQDTLSRDISYNARSVVNISIQINLSTNSSSFYHFNELKEGIDISILCNKLIFEYSLPQNILSIISRCISAKYIYSYSKEDNGIFKTTVKYHSSGPLCLFNKNRYHFEDFTYLPNEKELTILISNLSKKDTSHRVLKGLLIIYPKNYMQFRNDRNTKYYAFAGFVSSNLYYSRVLSSCISLI